MELEDRDELRETLEEWHNLVGEFGKVSTRLQARLDQFSAKHGISPPLDILAGTPPPEELADELFEALGDEDMQRWARIHENARNSLIQAGLLADQTLARQGDKPVQVLSVRGDNHCIGLSVPDFVSETLAALKRLGFNSWLDDRTEPDCRLFTVMAGVEEPMVDGFVLKMKLLGNDTVSRLVQEPLLDPDFESGADFLSDELDDEFNSDLGPDYLA